MRKLILFALLLVSVAANASKAMSTPFECKQSDGTTIHVTCFGDESFSYITALDGTLLVKTIGSFFVAEVQEDGSLVSSGVLAHDPQQRSAREQEVAIAQNRALFFATSEKRYGSLRTSFGNITPPAGLPAYVPHSGTVKVPVIFVQFPDEQFLDGNIDALKSNLMDEEYTPKTSGMSFNGTKYSSVKNYYADASDGKLNLQFDFYGPYTTTSGKHYYAYQNGKGYTGKRLMQDILPIADSDIDFSQYDNNADGLADICVFICAGKMAQTGIDKENDIWSACGCLGSANVPSFTSNDGVGVCRYLYDSELLTNNFNGAPLHNGVGTFCHEFGHGLGLPDLYYNATWASANNGPEQWDLMDYGENIRNGFWPIPLSIWERVDFGWTEPTLLDQPQDVTVWPLADSEGRGKAYMIQNPDNQNEFWTIENIPSDGWYAGVLGKGTGMVIQHVNYSDAKFINAYPNSVQGKPNCTMIPADGWLENNTAELQGDPYPGSTGKTSLDAYKNYAGGQDLVNTFPITDIVLNEDGSVSFKFMGGDPTGIQQHKTEAGASTAYTLSGQCVDNKVNTRGIFIVNGKKIIR